MDEKKLTLQELQVLGEAVENATEEYERRTMEYDRTRSCQTAALNSLNEAQKAFDKGLENFAGAAPRDSDWWNRKHRKPRAVA